MWGTGNDLNTGSFVTLNGKKVKDSIADFRKAFSEANLLGGTKKGTLFSWLAGDFNKDYDLAKDLDKEEVEKINNYVGRYIFIHIVNPIDGYNSFEGTLVDCDDDSISLEIRIKTRKKIIKILKNNIDL